MHIQQWRGRRLVVALLLALSAIIPALMPGSAEASATGCRAVNFGNYCFNVTGTSTYIEVAGMGRSKSGWICNARGVVVVRDSGSNVLWREEKRSSGCNWWNHPGFGFSIYNHFPNNSKICGIWFEDGVSGGSEICHTILE